MDELSMIVNALTDGTRWYKCSRGHPYSVGECGMRIPFVQGLGLHSPPEKVPVECVALRTHIARDREETMPCNQGARRHTSCDQTQQGTGLFTPK